MTAGLPPLDLAEREGHPEMNLQFVSGPKGLPSYGKMSGTRYTCNGS